MINLIIQIICCSIMIFSTIIFILFMIPRKLLVIPLNKLHIVEGIILEDFEHSIYYTWKIKHPFVKNAAFIYPMTRVGMIILNEDGTVSNSYIKTWKLL